MDRYDSLILEIIDNYHTKENRKERINLRSLEQSFWESIKTDADLTVGKGRIGERIARMYVDGLIENKNGYRLTRRGRSQLGVATTTL